MILSDTTVFNDLLKALDTGKTVYLYNFVGYSTIAYFGVIMEDVLLIHVTTPDGVQYTILPSEGYSDSDLYTPTNLIIQVAPQIEK